MTVPLLTIWSQNTFIHSFIKDIFQFKSFADLKKEVDELNAMGSESKSELRDDYEIIMDDDKFLIAVPHTHEASRYLGLSKFQYRDCEGGGKDSAWCTTYKAPDHFNDYYFKQHITFYYIKLKNEAMIELAKAAFPARGGAMVVTAVLVDKNGKKFGKSENNALFLDESLTSRE